MEAHRPGSVGAGWQDIAPWYFKAGVLGVRCLLLPCPVLALVVLLSTGSGAALQPRETRGPLHSCRHYYVIVRYCASQAYRAIRFHARALDVQRNI
jgi:hypothetical protein